MGQYSDNFVERLHLVWGPGFMSPGGAEEVAEIVSGLELEGALVLDIGCGTGGPSIALARDMGAYLICIDVEQHLLDRAKELARQEGVGDRIEFKLVEPGPLPFQSETFDAVFSKDALIHMPNKMEIYREILRVLRPGGALAASDWLAGENAITDGSFQEYLRVANLDFIMATAEQIVQVMRDAGFECIRTTDRNAWYAALSTIEVEQIKGPLREQIVSVSDLETYNSWLSVRCALANAAKSGGLRPTHLRGYRPKVLS